MLTIGNRIVSPLKALAVPPEVAMIAPLKSANGAFFEGIKSPAKIRDRISFGHLLPYIAPITDL